MSRQIACRRRQAAKEESKRGRPRPALLATALALGVLPTGGALADDTAEIQVRRMVGGPSDGSHWILQGVGVELPLQGGRSWTARGGAVQYRYRPIYSLLVSDYREDGSGSFLGVGFRLYHGAESKGWYFGVNLDYISVGVDWERFFHSPPPQPPPERGHGEIAGYVPGISGGYKAFFDYGITFEADFYAGRLSKAAVGELGATGISGLELALGKRF